MGSRGRRVMILFRLLLGIYAIGDSDKPRKGEKKREGAKSACLRNPISVLSVPSDRLDRGQREAGSDGGIHFYFFIRQRSTCLPFMIVWLLHQFTNFPNAVCPVRFLISWCSFLSPSRSFFPIRSIFLASTFFFRLCFLWFIACCRGTDFSLCSTGTFGSRISRQFGNCYATSSTALATGHEPVNRGNFSFHVHRMKEFVSTLLLELRIAFTDQV